MAGERSKKSRPERPSKGGVVSTYFVLWKWWLLILMGSWIAGMFVVLETMNALLLGALSILLVLIIERAPDGEVRTRRCLGVGALLMLIGIAGVGIGPHEIAAGVTLIALLALAYGIHTFGRLGPEQAPPRA